MSGLLDQSQLQAYIPANDPKMPLLQSSNPGTFLATQRANLIPNAVNAMGSTGTEGLTYEQVQQNAALGQLNTQLLQNQAMQAANAQRPQIVGKTADGDNIWSNPNTGGFQTASGESQANPNQIAQVAGLARAAQGLNPGQSNAAQLKSDSMQKLMSSISDLPKEDQHTAYERAVGVLAGKGVVQIHDLPSWENGGRDFMMKMAQLQNQGQIAVANVNAQNQLQNTALQGQNQAQVAAINQQPNLIKSNVLANSYQQAQQGGGSQAQNQLQATLNNPLATPSDKHEALEALQSMGVTGGPGLPAAAPISARAASTFANADQGLQSVNEMAKLYQTGTINPALAIAGGKTGVTNALLSSPNQQYNDLRTQLTGAIDSLKADPNVDKGTLDHLSDLVPGAGDKPETVQAKLATLQKQFSTIKTVLNPAGDVNKAVQQQAPVQANASAQQVLPSFVPPGVQPAQWQQIQQLRMAKLAQMQQAQPRPQQMPSAQQPVPTLMPGDRMDYNT